MTGPAAWGEDEEPMKKRLSPATASAPIHTAIRRTSGRGEAATPNPFRESNLLGITTSLRSNAKFWAVGERVEGVGRKWGRQGELAGRDAPRTAWRKMRQPHGLARDAPATDASRRGQRSAHWRHRDRAARFLAIGAVDEILGRHARPGLSHAGETRREASPRAGHQDRHTGGFGRFQAP